MLHSIMVISGGFLLLAVFVLVARQGKRGANALRFIPLWLALSLINMVIGIFWAGYSWQSEALILIPVFLIPGIAAIIVARMIKS